MATLRPLTPADLTAADTILNAAYRWHGEWAELRMYLALQPTGWLLAEHEQQPIGLAGALNYGPLAYIGLVGVLPSWQRQGVGRRLMNALLAHLDAAGCPTAVLDATPAGMRLYSECGFVEDEQTETYAQNFCVLSPPTPHEVTHWQPTDLEEIIAFDTPIFGAERRTVLARLFAEYADRAFVVRRNQIIEGYLIARYDQLGPWVAINPQATEGLLHAAMHLPFAGPPRVQVPGANRTTIQLLEEYGFVHQRTLHHMRRGRPANRQRTWQAGLTSLAIG
jgi:GNAT superfamily N-acetyltransferase